MLFTLRHKGSIILESCVSQELLFAGLCCYFFFFSLAVLLLLAPNVVVFLCCLLLSISENHVLASSAYLFLVGLRGYPINHSDPSYMGYLL